MPNQTDTRATISTSEIRVQLRNLLEIALTKRKVSLGGKQYDEREDLQAAIKVIELILRTFELDTPPMAKLLSIIHDAPAEVADAWLKVNKYLLLPRAMKARAQRATYSEEP